MAEKAYKRLFLRFLNAEMSDLLAKQSYRVARSKISNILEIRTYLNIKVFLRQPFFVIYLLRIFEPSSCDNLLIPMSIMLRLSSASKLANTASTPACPPAARPYK